MHGKLLRNVPGINVIFQREANGIYTKDAQLYQDILRYSIIINQDNQVNNDASFRPWDLAGWLVENNHEYKGLYQGRHVKKNYKIENTLPRIKRKINDMEHLYLIEESIIDKAKKVDTDITLYRYTKSGYFLAWLIDTENENEYRRSTAIQKVHDIVNLYLSTKDTSRSTFLSNFFQRCEEKGIFVNNPTYFLSSSGEIPPLTNELSLLELFLDVPNTLYWVTTYPAIFIETLDNLDAEIKKALLFQFKMEIEVFYNNYYSTKHWEIMRYNNISNYSTVTVPGFCSGCNSEVPFQYDIINYFHSLSTMKMPYPSGIITTTCTKCGKEYCLSGRIMGVPWHAIVRT
jgi:hypothetical protein